MLLLLIVHIGGAGAVRNRLRTLIAPSCARLRFPARTWMRIAWLDINFKCSLCTHRTFALNGA